MQQDEVNMEILKLEFADFDRELGAFLLRFAAFDIPEISLAGMLTAYELRSGNPQLDLAAYAGKTIEMSPGEYVTLPSVEAWKEILFQSKTASLPGGAVRTPLIFTGETVVMFHRYAEHAGNIRKLLQSFRMFSRKLQMPESISADLDQVQQLAVFVGTNSRLLILSGGPGTGKTTVCGHIIRALLEKNDQRRILFAAPTGKAQQRLAAQIRAAGDDLPESSPVRRAIREVKGATLHSFVLNPEWYAELESCDLLIVDECSMISLEMFSRLLSVLPPTASLILAGDRRQLVSIDSGSVFADLCNYGKVNQLPETAADYFKNETGIAVEYCEKNDDFSGSIVELQRNFRSSEAPAICRIAAMLRENMLPDETAADFICAADKDDFRFRNVAEKDLASEIGRRCAELKELPQLCRSGDPGQIRRALEIADSSKFICAVNRGRYGTVEVNNCLLNELGITPVNNGEWLPGTALLITANDRHTGLRNGDIGIVTLEKIGTENLPQRCVRFSSCPEKCFPLSGLPAHECGFAISVHRSQGSGYNKVTFLLPGYDSAVLCRELLYTGITRAAKEIELWGSRDELLFALKNSRERSSNLFKNA